MQTENEKAGRIAATRPRVCLGWLTMFTLSTFYWFINVRCILPFVLLITHLRSALYERAPIYAYRDFDLFIL